jgi:AraC-like DNA-binding protein
MEIQIFKYKVPHPLIDEIREVKSGVDLLTHFVPPMCNPEVIFYVGNKAQINNVQVLNCFLKGLYNKPQNISFQPGYHFLSVVLKPYGLKQLFNLNANELLNSVVDLEDMPMARLIMKAINEMPTIKPETILLITKLLEGCQTFPVSPSTIEAVNLIQQGDYHNISTMIKDKGIGLRSLQRNFRKEIGVTPKEFLRIHRMNKVEQRLAGKTSFMQIVADFDFSDQSHLVKEFRKLRNYSPQEMVKKKLFLSDQLPIPEIIRI